MFTRYQGRLLQTGTTVLGPTRGMSHTSMRIS